MKASTFKKQFLTVTPLSRRIALILVIALPFIGFYFGYSYPKYPSMVVVQSAATKNLSPQQVTQNFYTDFVTCANKPQSIVQCDWKNSPWVDHNLQANLLSKKTNITCSVNIPIGVVSQLVKADSDQAIVNSYQVYEMETEKIEVWLKNDNGNWKIDNINCPNFAG